MNIKLQLPGLMHLQPRITVVGVGGAGSNAVNNMIASGLSGVNFVVANTDSQSLANSSAEHRIQLGAALTEGLGAGARPEIGKAAAEEAVEEIRSLVSRSHMVFVAAGMGGGTGTGAAAVIARVAREAGALTVGVVTKPFQFEGTRRMRAAEIGIAALRPEVDTLIVIPNQNLFRIANERTTFADAFVLADQVLYSGIACVVDLIVKEGLINLDFADVRTIMSGMGTAMMGTGEASGERRATAAAEEAISNPLLDDISLRGAKGLLVSITGGRDLTLYEVDEAATRVRQEVDAEANIIVGATFDDKLGDKVRVSIVASGMERLSEAGQLHATAAARDMRQPAQTAPAIPFDNQPPFIEPYPAAYTEQEARPLPPSKTEHAPQRMQWIQSDHGVENDLTRALSDALGRHEEPQHFQPTRPLQAPARQTPPQSQQPVSWTSPDGAVFQEAPPQLAPWSPQPPHQSAGPAHKANEQANYAPQPPADPLSAMRRIPQVEDFPLVGQREFHAKSAQYGNPTAAPPRAYTSQQAEPPAKLGLFARLLGRRRKEQSRPPESTGYQQAPAAQRSGQDRAPVVQRSTPQSADLSSPQRAEQAYELPVFFGAAKK
jgi:cell division protein FtsZ